MGDVTTFIGSMAPDFRSRNEHGLNFESEMSFSVQRINANSYLAETAKKNQDSLRAAIMNVASIGITLSPAEQLAYLVPREGAVRLELSYRGMIKLAIDSGSILWAQPETVYEGDHFVWNGFACPPEHQFDPFDTSRVDIEDPFKGLRGGYCTAKLPDGSWLVARMTAAEIIKVRESSKANNGPWLARYKDRRGKEHRGWPEEMIKKTLIKRAYKTWPPSSRLNEAVELDNQHNGLTLEHEEPVAELTDERREHLDTIAEELKRTDITEAKLCQIAGVKMMDEIATERLTRCIDWLKRQVKPENTEEAA